MSTTGFEDGPPTATGAQIGDSGTGIHLVAAILAALYQRTSTGRGQRVQVAMQDAVLNLCRVKLRDQQRLAHGPLGEYPNDDFGDEVPRSGNASGGGQPGWAVKCAPGGPNDYIYVIVQPPGWAPLARADRQAGAGRGPGVGHARGPAVQAGQDVRARSRSGPSSTPSGRCWSSSTPATSRAARSCPPRSSSRTRPSPSGLGRRGRAPRARHLQDRRLPAQAVRLAGGDRAVAAARRAQRRGADGELGLRRSGARRAPCGGRSDLSGGSDDRRRYKRPRPGSGRRADVADRARGKRGRATRTASRPRPRRLATTADEAVALAERHRLPGGAQDRLAGHPAQDRSRRRAGRLEVDAEGAARLRARSSTTPRPTTPTRGSSASRCSRCSPAGQEVIVGAVTDPTFGKIVAFGLGGVLVEVLKDVTFRLAPTSTERSAVDGRRHPSGRDPARRARRRIPSTGRALAARDHRVSGSWSPTSRRWPRWTSTRCSPPRPGRPRSTSGSWSTRPRPRSRCGSPRRRSSPR